MKHIIHGTSTAEIVECEKIKNSSDFLDIIGNIHCKNYIFKKEQFDSNFFDLSTKIAGDILQKISNYNKRLAIIGDYSKIKSKALKDFIYEGNKTKQVIFVDEVEEALRIFEACE